MNFPDTFHDPSLINDKTDRELVALALCGWAVCMAGRNVTVPEKFGEVMVKIRDKFGMKQPPTPEGFMEFSEKFETE